MAYLSITPVQDWFFRHDGPAPGHPPVVYQVAAWALCAASGEDGRTQVVGLISATIGGMDGRTLREVPPVPGCYLHRDQLSDEERSASTGR